MFHHPIRCDKAATKRTEEASILFCSGTDQYNLIITIRYDWSVMFSFKSRWLVCFHKQTNNCPLFRGGAIRQFDHLIVAQTTINPETLVQSLVRVPHKLVHNEDWVISMLFTWRFVLGQIFASNLMWPMIEKSHACRPCDLAAANFFKRQQLPEFADSGQSIARLYCHWLCHDAEGGIMFVN